MPAVLPKTDEAKNPAQAGILIFSAAAVLSFPANNSPLCWMLK
jgi:hypothetical protein